MTGTPAFYVTSAQVIPVLLLVVAIELRFFSAVGTPFASGARLFIPIGLFVAIAAGEILALRAVYRDEGDLASAIVVWFSIGLLLLVIGTAAIVLPGGDTDESDSRLGA
jgi:hypothetical protein